jgi:hypothetical protein
LPDGPQHLRVVENRVVKTQFAGPGAVAWVADWRKAALDDDAGRITVN